MNQTSKTNKKAIIAGGGIGGLNAALCFHKFGWDVEVLEQAPQLGEVGAGIQISPNGVKVLRALGIDKRVEAGAFRPRALHARMGKSGRMIFASTMEKYEERFGAPYLHIHRADLISAFTEALDERLPGAVRTGTTVTGYDQNENEAWAILEDGSTVKGDVVVAGDGIRSAIRTQMLGEDTPRFTGNVAWRAVVPVEKLGDNVPLPVASGWLGEGKHGVTYLLRGGKLANFVGVVERDDWQEESWTQKGTREEALKDFEGWHPIITTLIEQADEHFRWALFDRDPLDQWVDGRVALLGDACHPMLPFLAQGAVQAIEDGYALARFLSEHEDVNKALSTYFDARIERTSRVQAGARANMKTFHQRTALGKLKTYGPMWMVGKLAPGLANKRMEWMYAHDVTAS